MAILQPCLALKNPAAIAFGPGAAAGEILAAELASARARSLAPLAVE